MGEVKVASEQRGEGGASAPSWKVKACFLSVRHNELRVADLTSPSRSAPCDPNGGLRRRCRRGGCATLFHVEGGGVTSNRVCRLRNAIGPAEGIAIGAV